MRELSFLDVLVYFLIAVWGLLCDTTFTEILSLFSEVFWSVPGVLLALLYDNLRPADREESHYRNVANPIQQIIIQLTGFAFDRVHFRVGRVFLGSKTALRFLHWRHGPGPFYDTFTIPTSKKHKETLVYRIDGGLDPTRVKRVVLYVHGGGLVVASVPFYLEFLIALQSACTDTIIVSPEYSLAPESVYPTQLRQVMATYDHIKLHYPACQVIIGGDSAGAGLCQSLLLNLSFAGSRKIDGVHRAFYISPWLDFSTTYPRLRGHGDYIGPEALQKYGQWYTRSMLDQISDEPDPSPLNSSREALSDSIPPAGLLMLWGSAECLSSECQLFASMIKHKNLQVHIEKNEIHAFILVNLYLRRHEARWKSFDKIVHFIMADDR